MRLGLGFFYSYISKAALHLGLCVCCSQRDAFTPQQTWKAESLSGLIIAGTRTASGYTCVTLRTARLNDALVTENRSVLR